MNRTLLTFLFCACLMLTPAQAQQPGDPATKEDVQQLFDLMQSRKMFEGIIDAVMKQMPEMTRSTLKKQMPNASPEQIAAMEAFTKDMTEKVLKNMPFDELMGAAMPAYQRHFTHSEMQSLIEFYSSPVGKKMIASMPAIMADYMQNATPIMQSWMEKQVADMQKSTEAYVKALKDAEAKEQSTAAEPQSKS